MTYRPPRELKRGRVYAQLGLDNLNLPRLNIYVDGECCVIGLSYGNGSSDPVALIDLTLSETRAGKLIGDAYWWVRERSGR